jgi:hypothetical protein
MIDEKIEPTINLNRYINEQANIVYGGKGASFNHTAYINYCSDAFAKYFKNNFNNRYLFSTLSAWNRKKADGVIFANPDKRYDYNNNVEGIFQPIIEGHNNIDDSLLNDIPKKSISITKYILQESYGIDVFFEGDSVYESPIKCNKDMHKIYFFPLTKINFYSEIEDFENDSFNKQAIIKLANKLKIQNDYDYTYPKVCRLLWYYKKMQVEYKKETEKDFMVHFIRPSFIDFDHNMLLSLATNDLLDKEELAIVDLILFKIVGLMATERVKEVEALKTKTMFSLTTHSLKTHLNTTVIKEKNAFLDKLVSFNELKEDFENYLGKEVDTLFRLTEILSLVDKINDKQKFINTAKGTELLSESIITYNLEEHLTQFNRRKNIERTEPDIKICSNANLKAFTIPINIYDLYLGKDLIELFFNTIFENIVVYGKPESGYRNLVIKIEENQMVFSNKTLRKIIPVDETKLTGNYGLFKKLFKDTDSGKLSISSAIDHEFKIIISYGK